MFRCHVNASIVSRRFTYAVNHKVNTTRVCRKLASNTTPSTTTVTTPVPNPVKWKNQAPKSFLEKSEYIKQFDEDYLQEELKKQSDRIMTHVKIRTNELKHIFFKWIPYVFEQRRSVDYSKVMQHKRLQRILIDRIDQRTHELGAYNELVGNVKELTDEEVLQELDMDHSLLDEEELFQIRLAGLPMVIKEPLETLPIYEFPSIPFQEKTQAHIDEAHKRFLIADARLKEIRDELRNFSSQHGDHYRKYQYYTGELKNTQDRLRYIVHEISEYLRVYIMILKMRGPDLKKEMIHKLSNFNLWLVVLLLLLLLLLLMQIWNFFSWSSLDEWNVAYAWSPSKMLPSELYVTRPDLNTKLKAIFQESVNKRHGVYVVLGERGCGKTTLLEQVISELGRTDVIQLHATTDEEHLAAQLGQVLDKKPSIFRSLSQNSNNASFDSYIVKFCDTCARTFENTNIIRKLLQIAGFWPQTRSPIMLLEDLDSALVLDQNGTSQSPVMEKLIRTAHKIGVENNLCKVIVVATPAVLPHLSQVSKQLSDFEFLYVGDLTPNQAQDFLMKHSDIRGWQFESNQTRNITTTLGTRCSVLLDFVKNIDTQHKTKPKPIDDNLIKKSLQIRVLQAHKQLKTVPPQCQQILKEWAEETKSNKTSQRSEEWIKAKFKSSLWDYQFVAYKTLLQKGIIKWNPVEKTVDFNTPLMLNTAKLLSNK